MEKCTICGKEYEGRRAKQSLILHMEKAHKMRKVKGEDRFISHDDLEQPCEGQWRLLNPNDPTEKACMDAGYKECYEMAGVKKEDWDIR